MYAVPGKNSASYGSEPPLKTMILPLASGVMADMPIYEKKKYNGPFGLSCCGTACLYLFFIALFFVGAGGVAVSLAFYLLSYPYSDSVTDTWKIVGVAAGGFVVAVSLIILIIFACDHGKQTNCIPSVNRNNKVGNSYAKSDMNTVSGFTSNGQTAEVTITGAYYIDEPENVKNDYINAQAQKLVQNKRNSKRKSSRQKKNRVSSVLDDLSDNESLDDEINNIRMQNSSRLYSNHHRMPYHSAYHQPYPQYPTYPDPNNPLASLAMHNPMLPMPHHSAAPHHPMLPMPPHSAMPNNQPIERPPTVIKEIHHHHYGPPPSSALPIEAPTNPVETQQPNDSHEIQTYKLNSNTGQLQLVNSMTRPISVIPQPQIQAQPQIVSLNQPPGIQLPPSGKWVVVRNTVPKLISATQGMKPIIVQGGLPQQGQQIVMLPPNSVRNSAYQPLTEEDED